MICVYVCYMLFNKYSNTQIPAAISGSESAARCTELWGGGSRQQSWRSSRTHSANVEQIVSEHDDTVTMRTSPNQPTCK